MSYPVILPIMDHPDNRGSHTKVFGNSPERLLVKDYNIHEVFITTNNKDVVRGMHYQTPGQDKIITVLTGSLIGNILDANPASETFGEVFHYELSANSKARIHVPGDWALGYRILEDNTKVLYLANEDFSPTGDTGIDPFDKELALNWGTNITKASAILSNKDLELQSWSDYRKAKGL